MTASEAARKLAPIPKGYTLKRANKEAASIALHAAFELIGGLPRFAHWGSENPGQFYTLWAKLAHSNTETPVGATTINIVNPFTAPAAEVVEQAIMSLVKSRVSVAESTMKNMLNRHLYLDGTGNNGKNILGLRNLDQRDIADVVGGSWLDHRAGRSVGMIVTDQKFAPALLGWLDQRQRQRRIAVGTLVRQQDQLFDHHVDTAVLQAPILDRHEPVDTWRLLQLLRCQLHTLQAQLDYGDFHFRPT